MIDRLTKQNSEADRKLSFELIVSSETDAEPQERLRQIERTTIAGIREACLIFAEMARRGEVIPADNLLHMWFPYVADGRLAPEIVYAFFRDINLVACFVGMDIDDQLRFAREKMVDVAVLDKKTGMYVARSIDLLGFQKAMLPQVFQQSKWVPINEQIKFAKERSDQKKRVPSR